MERTKTSEMSSFGRRLVRLGECITCRDGVVSCLTPHLASVRRSIDVVVDEVNVSTDLKCLQKVVLNKTTFVGGPRSLDVVCVA